MSSAEYFPMFKHFRNNRCESWVFAVLVASSLGYGPTHARGSTLRHYDDLPAVGLAGRLMVNGVIALRCKSFQIRKRIAEIIDTTSIGTDRIDNADSTRSDSQHLYRA